jgi:hypothetical protein
MLQILAPKGMEMQKSMASGMYLKTDRRQSRALICFLFYLLFWCTFSIEG